MPKRNPLSIYVMNQLEAAGRACQEEWKQRRDEDGYRDALASPDRRRHQRLLRKAIRELEQLAWVDAAFFPLSKHLAATRARLELLDIKDQDRETDNQENMRPRVPHREARLEPLLRALTMFVALGQKPMTMCSFCEQRIVPQLPDADGMKKGDLYDLLRHWKKPTKRK